MDPITFITRPLLNRLPNKEVKYSPLEQIGLGSLVGGIPTATLALLGYKIPTLLPVAAGGFLWGSNLLPLQNALIQLKKKQQLKDAEEAIKQHVETSGMVGLKAKSIGETIKNIGSKVARLPDLSKQASFGSAVTNLAGKSVWEVTKAVGKGFLPTAKAAPIGEKIWGLGVKGAGVGAATLGTFKGIDYLKRQQPYNYTTFLRNNILAGTIRPAELNVGELQSVKRLGMA